MNPKPGERIADVPAALLAHTPPELDDLPPEDLRALATGDIAAHGFTPAIADRLDAVFTLKAVRLLRAGHAGPADFRALDALVAAIDRDRHRAALDAMPARYHARWQALRDAMAVAQKLNVFAESVNEQAPATPVSAWETVAACVLQGGDAGVPWADVARALWDSPSGPRSKSGVSQLLTAMQAKGWVESLPRGRTKSLYPGRNLHESQAWKRQQATRPLPMAERSAPAAPADALSQPLSGHVADTARRLNCLNQGALLEFGYVAYRLHREMEAALRPLRQSRAAGRNLLADRTRLAKTLVHLVTSLRTRFEGMAHHNFDELKAYYAPRGATLPRLCIKSGCTEQPTGRFSVAPIIRDTPAQPPEGTPAGDRVDTGLRTVVQSGASYLNHDIAASALVGLYTHPGLDPQALAQLGGSISQEGVSRLPVQSWMACWRDPARRRDPRSCYRSTLIVPMTLRNNSFTDEFKALLRSGVGDAGVVGQRFDSTILGFLCLDHPHAGYFQHSPDVEMGYVAADLLSMYLFASMAFTVLSPSYLEAVRAVSTERGHSLIFEQERSVAVKDVTSRYADLADQARASKAQHNVVLDVAGMMWKGLPQGLAGFAHAKDAGRFLRPLDG